MDRLKEGGLHESTFFSLNQRFSLEMLGALTIQTNVFLPSLYYVVGRLIMFAFKTQSYFLLIDV